MKTLPASEGRVFSAVVAAEDGICFSLEPSFHPFPSFSKASFTVTSQIGGVSAHDDDCTVALQKWSICTLEFPRFELPKVLEIKISNVKRWHLLQQRWEFIQIGKIQRACPMRKADLNKRFSLIPPTARKNQYEPKCPLIWVFRNLDLPLLQTSFGRMKSFKLLWELKFVSFGRTRAVAYLWISFEHWFWLIPNCSDYPPTQDIFLPNFWWGRMCC